MDGSQELLLGLPGWLCPRAPPYPHAQRPSPSSEPARAGGHLDPDESAAAGTVIAPFLFCGCLRNCLRQRGRQPWRGVQPWRGTQAAPPPPQEVPPSSRVGIETTEALPRRRRVPPLSKTPSEGAAATSQSGGRSSQGIGVFAPNQLPEDVQGAVGVGCRTRMMLDDVGRLRWLLDNIE